MVDIFNEKKEMKYEEWKDKYPDYEVVTKKSQVFWKVFAVFSIILAFLFFSFIVYIWYINGYQGMIQAYNNNTVKVENPVHINNSYQFNPYTPVDNQVKNEYQIINNYTIINYIVLNNTNRT